MAKSHPSQEVATGIDDAFTKELTFDSLWHLHVNERLPRRKIAEIFDITGGEVRNKLVTFGVFRPNDLQFGKCQLERLYYEEGLTIDELSERLDVGTSTISRHLRYYGLNKNPWELRNRGGGHYRPYCSFRTNTRGYEVWSIPNGSYPVHRLVAVAEYGIDAVAGKEIHHKNGVKWDNRPENLQPITRQEHTKHSNKKSVISFLRKYDDQTVKEILKKSNYRKLADKMDV